AHRELETMANTDVLTGLPNRRFLLSRLEEEIAEADRFERPLAFALLDIDHFKRINDRYGHMAGDEVLRHVGRVILANLRRYDIAARFGGEEFAVAFPNTDRKAAEAVAARMREGLETETIEVSEAEVVRVTASFGLVERRPGEPVEEMIRRADEALYAAKNAGRNRVVCA
ncbi:MAG TPA: GGDEF domain-containing protein, partial [Rhodospirillales bacterium]|nr:GGDEF domain-containing protein [Rhodospirillales bacterium]